MRTIDLETLDIFHTVVREGGIVRAAARLNRVPSNVTTRIKQLEERLGVALFQRRGRTIAVTDAGRTLLAYAERLLQLAEEAENATLDARTRGHLRLGSMESTAASRLPALLSRFHRQHPHMSLTIETGTTGALLRKVRDYRLDAAFVGEPFDRTGVSARPVFAEDLVLVSGRGGPPLSRPADLRSATLLAFTQGCAYRKRLEQWLAEAEVATAGTLELASYHAILACAASGAGIAIMPLSVIEACRRTADITVHTLPAAIARNTTHLVWAGEPSPQLDLLLDLLPTTPRRRRA